MIVQGQDQINLRAVAGEVDMQLRHITFVNYPLYQESRDQGDYHLLTWPQGFVSDACIQPFIEHKDPVLREILMDKRFRYALSLGMDRQEIVESIYLGTTEPTQVSPLQTSPHYWEEQAKNMIEHDPDRANGYLDEMGLTERDSQGYRLRPDGKRLSLIFEYAPTFGSWADLAVLLTSHWSELGIELIPKEINRQLWAERRGAYELDITVWTTGGEFNPILFREYFMGSHGVEPWRDWWESDGTEGVEPPAFYKRQRELSEQIDVTVDPQERAELFREILEIHKEQMVIIGVTTSPPQIVVVKNDFRNVPESAVSDWNLLTPANAFPDQFYIRQS
jgi:peptide/nickel transport system substrate-binding protein